MLTSRTDQLRVGRRLTLAGDAPLKTHEDAYRVFVDREASNV